MDHQAGKGNEMQARHGFGQAFIVFGQASEPARPSETALDDPAPGQADKAAFGLRQLHHFQANAMRCRVRRGLYPGIPLIDIGECDRISGGRLDRRRQRGDQRPNPGRWPG